MQIADGCLLEPGAAGADVSAAAAIRPLVMNTVIEPWIPTVPDVVVYEYGARLDAQGAAAADQILKARHLYNGHGTSTTRLIGSIRVVHTQMNQWVLERAGAHAQDLARAKLTARANWRSPVSQGHRRSRAPASAGAASAGDSPPS